jgi:hypothetical protein
MKHWVYVICERIDGQPSFRHGYVLAKNEVDAYAAGHRLIRQPKGNDINDYVIELYGQPSSQSHSGIPIAFVLGMFVGLMVAVLSNWV